MLPSATLAPRSGMRVITDSRALGCLDIFDNKGRIHGVDANVWILHGMEDEDVPFSHGVELARTLGERGKVEKWWVEGRGHNDCLTGNDIVFEGRLKEFYDRCDARGGIQAVKDVGGMERGGTDSAGTASGEMDYADSDEDENFPHNI